MAQTDDKLKTLAKKLLPLSRDEKTISAQQVDKTLSAIKKQFPPRQLRLLLRHYLKFIKQALKQEQAIIEHAGSINPSEITSITQVLSQHYNRPIITIQKQTPELIAGIKIRIADDVYDTSITRKLQILQSKN